MTQPAETRPISGPRRRLSPIGWVLLLALLGYGTWLRTAHLADHPFWVDEAESSINALTILQHGVPTDSYLGLPIYENMLTVPWPGNPEFEFRDSSYSRKGIAVYHAWIPLYSIATSFALSGVRPDAVQAEPHVIHTREQMRQMTLAARLPAAVFALVFMVCIFFSAREIFGPDAGWPALTVAVVSSSAVYAGRNARYYSALLAMTSLCAWSLWRTCQRGRWRDFALTGLAIALLFHAHSLSCLITCGMVAVMAPFLLRHRHGFWKLALLGSIVAAGIIPWAFATGFVGSATHIPAVRSLFDWRLDLLDWPTRQLPFVILTASTLAVLLAIRLLGSRRPASLRTEFGSRQAPLLFFAAWSIVAFASFIALMPAASYFLPRLTLVVFVAGILFTAGALTAAARTVWRSGAGLLSSAAVLSLLVAGGKAWFVPPSVPAGVPTLYDVIDQLRPLPSSPDLRYFATPNNHLIFTVYTGMPVASVAPVRAEFLRSYPGPIRVLEDSPYPQWMGRDQVRKQAGPSFHLTDEEADDLSAQTRRRVIQYHAQQRAAGVIPPPIVDRDESRRLMFSRLMASQVHLAYASVKQELLSKGAPIFRGYEIDNYEDFWCVFFYRFISPTDRWRDRLNYIPRTRQGTATILPLEWVIYDCPPLDRRPHPVR